MGTFFDRAWIGDVGEERGLWDGSREVYAVRFLYQRWMLRVRASSIFWTLGGG